MLKIRAGWEQLITAQLLWIQAMAEAALVNVRVLLESDDPRIFYASGQRMPTVLRQFMRRMRPRAMHLAKHTCDVCGATTEVGGNFPIRCSIHIDSEEKSVEIDLDDFANLQFPLHDLADMAVGNPGLAMLGDSTLAADLLSFSPELLSAAYALYESSPWDEALIEHIENSVYRASYMASDLSDSEFVTRKDVADAVASSNVVERLLNSQPLAAAVWTSPASVDINQLPV
jgi:hypothetical protein